MIGRGALADHWSGGDRHGRWRSRGAAPPTRRRDETLPPIRTTIAVTTTTSTTVPPGQRFYVIKGGDTLGTIATGFGVTVQSIVDLNGLANPDDIQAGQTIEIPSGVTVDRRASRPDHGRPDRGG